MKACVYYDGHCPFCLKSVSILKKLDWLQRLDYQNVHGLPFLLPKMLDEMHLLTVDGIYNGFEACRKLTWQLPLLWPLAPFLYIPGVPWVGQRIYLWIARNRTCKDGVCKL